MINSEKEKELQAIANRGELTPYGIACEAYTQGIQDALEKVEEKIKLSWDKSADTQSIWDLGDVLNVLASLKDSLQVTK